MCISLCVCVCVCVCVNSVVTCMCCCCQSNPSHRDLNVKEAWAQGYTGKGVVVTILDDGIEKDHPDLAKNYVSLDTS